MFERFTTEARDAVVAAQVEARRLDDGRIDTGHVVLGVAHDGRTLAGRLLADTGLEALRTRLAELGRSPGQDDEALRSIGIDPERVRAAVEASFGAGALERVPSRGFARRSGHIPFSRGAKKALELALREALRLKDRHIGPEHLLLGVLREGAGPGRVLLAEAGVDRAVVDAAILDARRKAG